MPREAAPVLHPLILGVPQMSNPLEHGDLSGVHAVVARLAKEAEGAAVQPDLRETILMRRTVAIACLNEGANSYYQALVERSDDLARHGRELCCP